MRSLLLASFLLASVFAHGDTIPVVGAVGVTKDDQHGVFSGPGFSYDGGLNGGGYDWSCPTADPCARPLPPLNLPNGGFVTWENLQYPDLPFTPDAVITIGGDGIDGLVTWSGIITWPDDGGVDAIVMSGTGTVTYALDTFQPPGIYHYIGASYQLTGTATGIVPEPCPFLLLGSGISLFSSRYAKGRIRLANVLHRHNRLNHGERRDVVFSEVPL